MEKVKEVLSRCVRCKQYNPIRMEGFRFIEAFEPGEKVAFDLIGPLEGKYVATAINYFSRFAIAKVLNSKASDGIVRFLEIVQRKLQAKTMISDGAKENISDNVGVFMDKHKIKHHITSSYHHCSNGRIEKFNRTLGEALKKHDPELRLSKRVDEAIKAYNQTIHSAIGLKPEEALNPEILDDVKKRQFDNRVERYKKLFNAKEQKKLELNDLVLIENSFHKFKGQPKFLEMGEVVGILSNDTYWVSRRNKCTKCHITQLRKISEDDFFL